MKIIGIIAEFNPFHNGHEYIIRTAKESCGADLCVVVMSGDFVQRGEPAICDKYLRTRMALTSGADAVFELPGIFSRASAEQFAYGSVALLSALGCIDGICFGSETGNIVIIREIARILVDEPAEYKAFLSDLLKSGLSFPASREQALRKYLAGEYLKDEQLRLLLLTALDNGLLSSPNDILGIEYCKAILRLRWAGINAPEPVAVKREGSSYGSSVPDTVSGASALALRKLIREGRLKEIRAFVPAVTYSILSDEFNRSFPIFADDFSSVLYSDLLIIKSSFNNYCKNSTISADLMNAILKNADDPISFTGLIEKLKTKNITYSAISRALISIMLDTSDMISAMRGMPVAEGADSISAVHGIPAAEGSDSICAVHAVPAAEGSDSISAAHALPVTEGSGSVLPPYARLLGIRRSSSALIKRINESAGCEIINKLADAKTLSVLLAKDIYAARLYDQIIYHKFGTRLPDEYRKTREII